MFNYTCNNCKKASESSWSEEEAILEKEKLFDDLQINKMDMVCDDCFKKIMDFNEPGLKRYDDEAQR